MGPTRLQVFWRWLVGIDVIVAAIGLGLGYAAEERASSPAWLAAHGITDAAGGHITAAIFFLPGALALTFLFFFVPIWLVVEVVSWAGRSRRRRDVIPPADLSRYDSEVYGRDNR